jgi:hypothetical protein
LRDATLLLKMGNKLGQTADKLAEKYDLSFWSVVRYLQEDTQPDN